MARALQKIRKSDRFFVCLLACGLFRAAMLCAQTSYPPLRSLGSDDYIYKQHQELLADSYEALAAGRQLPDLVIFEYRVPVPPPGAANANSGGTDLLSLAARLNLPYETLASLNRLDRIRSFIPGERVLVPSIPGLFAAFSPRSDLDYLMSYRGVDGGLRCGVASLDFYFFPGARFNAEERALFLGLLFRFPLAAGRLSSGFGPRLSPLSNKVSNHAGIDLAAREGTEVYAARDGLVIESGVDAVLGQYIAIQHDGGFSTLYGHLSMRRVRLNERVESGMIIGNVGSTGMSTGPHLHFEVRHLGKARDPEPLIPRGKR